MGKIIKERFDKKELNSNIKGSFKIEFVNDTFGPYDYKFAKEDCYFLDSIKDRGSFLFPLKNKQFDNTEIFLENDDVIICIGERGGLINDSSNFIDIINLKTEKRNRIFTNEVNLIYNSKDEIIVNCNDKDGIFKTYILDINTLEIKQEKEEKLLAFFKCVYNENTKKWFILDYNNETLEKQNIKVIENTDLGKTDFELFKSGYFNLKEIDLDEKPENFNRLEFSVNGSMEFSVNGSIDVWDLSNN